MLMVQALGGLRGKVVQALRQQLNMTLSWSKVWVAGVITNAPSRSSNSIAVFNECVKAAREVRLNSNPQRRRPRIHRRSSSAPE